jgi:hypothetical protein
MINWKGFILKEGLLAFFSERLRKITRNISQNNMCVFRKKRVGYTYVIGEFTKDVTYIIILYFNSYFEKCSPIFVLVTFKSQLTTNTNALLTIALMRVANLFG